MLKKLNQHEIRQRAVQTLYSYHVQRAMADSIIKDFKFNAGKVTTILSRPPRFEENYKDERIVIRGFQKGLTNSLSKLVEIYDTLGIEYDGSALALAMAFIRDFGGYTKKMRDNEALDLFNGVLGNLNYVRFFSIDLEDQAVAPKVLEFLHELPENASSEQAFASFNKVFAQVHENIREKYPVKFFEANTLQAELEKELAKAESRSEEEGRHLLANIERYVLNFDNEENEEVTAPDYLLTLLNGVLSHQEDLEKIISEHLAKKWNFERLTKIEQVILSLGAFEICYTETPDVVAVNEAIELAKNFSDVKSSRFVNGVLTNLVKKD